VHQPAQRQRRTLHQVRLERRQLQRVRPLPPVPLGLAPALGLAGRCGVQIVCATAEFEHHRALRRVDDGGGDVVHAVVVDAPLHAGGTQHHRVVGAEHLEPVPVGLEAHRHLAELRPGREGDHGPGVAADHPGQVGAGGGHVVRQVVGDLQTGPTRFDGHGAVHVALRQRQAGPFRRDAEVPGLRPAQQMGEHRGRVRFGVAEPGDGGVGGEQRHRARAGQHGQPLDARRARTGQPGAAFLEQEGQRAGDGLGAVHPVLGQALALAHLDADIGPRQHAERLLVGHVVAEEHRRRRALLVADGVQGGALVGLDDGQFDDRLALGDLHPDPARRTLADRFQRPAPDLGGGVAHVQRDTGRFRLDRGAGVVVGDLGQRGLDLVQQLLGVVVDGVHEADVELRAVAADQLDLDGQARECRQITQGAAGDHGRGGAGQPGEGA